MTDRKRKPHAATGGRVLMAGISVSATIAFAGAMAQASQPAPPTTPTAPATPAAPVVVRVVLPNGQTANATVVPATPAAAPVATPAKA